MSDVPRVRLTGRAARFLQLLQDFGHLDDEGVAQLLLGVAAEPGFGSGLLDLEELRRHTARMLFELSPDGAHSGLLAEDWPLLFS